MANPLNQLRDAVNTVIDGVTGINWTDEFAGEEFERMRHLAAQKGSGVFTRVLSAQGVDGPDCCDCAELTVHIILCATSLVGRFTAMQNAEELLWLIYAALKQGKAGLSFPSNNFKLDSWVIEDQSPNTCIVSIGLKIHVDFAQWSEA